MAFLAEVISAVLPIFIIVLMPVTTLIAMCVYDGSH